MEFYNVLDNLIYEIEEGWKEKLADCELLDKQPSPDDLFQVVATALRKLRDYN